MKRFVLLILLVPLLAMKCKKDIVEKRPLTPLEQLPPLTFEGKEKAGALVDGEAFYSKYGYAPGANAITSELNNGKFSLHIQMWDQGSLKKSMWIQMDNLTQTGIYTTTSGPVHVDYADLARKVEYNFGDGYQDFWFEVLKLDTVADIISGKFGGILHAPGLDTIHVTDGRFDLSL